MAWFSIQWPKNNFDPFGTPYAGAGAKDTGTAILREEHRTIKFEVNTPARQSWSCDKVTCQKRM